MKVSIFMFLKQLHDALAYALLLWENTDHEQRGKKTVDFSLQITVLHWEKQGRKELKAGT